MWGGLSEEERLVLLNRGRRSLRRKLISQSTELAALGGGPARHAPARHAPARHTPARHAPARHRLGRSRLIWRWPQNTGTTNTIVTVQLRTGSEF